MDQPQGNGAPEAPQGSAAPEAVNIDEKINKAITARFKSFEKQFESKIGESFGSFNKTLEDKFAALTPKPAEDASAKVANVEDHPTVRGLKRELREFKERYEQSERAAAAVVAKGRDATLRQKLHEELTKQGTDPSRLKHAVGYLVDVDKRVRWGDEESISFKDEDGQDIDLATGIKNWIKSDDGKLYMPPRGAAGSGDRPLNGRAAVAPKGETELFAALAKELGL